MLNEYHFIRIYKSLANGKAETKDILGLYSDLQVILGEDPLFAKWFQEESPDRLGAAIAIDAVAHEIHQNGEDTLHQIFPDAEYSIIKSELDKLAGLEKNSQIRQYNRGYFTTLLAEDSVFLLEKQLPQVGRTTREAILPAIKEYEKLYKAGLSSPAELLTLSRYYPDNDQYRATIIKLGLDNEDNHPVVVGGPASVEMIDREGHLITTEALDKAFSKFMANFRGRNLNILHSDVQIGWVLPVYITKDGSVFSSGVDDKQLWVLGEIRGDTRIAKRVAQEVLDKNLRSYSIAGSALDVQDMQKGANTFKQVNEMEMSEITLAVLPDTKIGIAGGEKNIQELQPGDLVLTHRRRQRKIDTTHKIAYDGEIIKITTDDGKILSLTPEHRVKIKNKGWIFPKDLIEGDEIIDGTPNRRGKHQKSWNKGFTKEDHPNLSGGIKTAEGRAKQIASVTSEAFRKKRSDIQKQVSQRPEIRENNSRIGKERWSNKTDEEKMNWIATIKKQYDNKKNIRRLRIQQWNNKTDEEKRLHMGKMRAAGHYTKGNFISKEENTLNSLLQLTLPNEWKYVGDWQFVIGGKCPDFINVKNNKIIELYGNYWHKNDDPQERIDYFTQFGYKTIVIWASELRNVSDLIEKITNFTWEIVDV